MAPSNSIAAVTLEHLRMARTKTRPLTLTAMLTAAPELKDVPKDLATMALAHVRQDGDLGVRQGEQLRRALATIGEAMGWTATRLESDKAMVSLHHDLLTLAKGGAKFLAKDLVDELALKKTEVERLQASSDEARARAENEKATYPWHIPYSYTVRAAVGDLVTKSDVLVINDVAECLSAADSVVKNIAGRTKLRDLMIIALEEKQVRVEAMTKTLPEFLQDCDGVLREVLANLQ